MAYTFEFEDEMVRAWNLTDEGAESTEITDYTPSIYVSAPEEALADLEERCDDDPKVCATGYDEKYTTFHDTKSSGAGSARSGSNGTAASETGSDEIGSTRSGLNGTASAGSPTRVLRIDLERCAEGRTLADEIRGVYGRESCAPGELRLFDVDFTPGFRYCLDEGVDPTPSRELRTIRIEIDETGLAAGDVSKLVLDGEPVQGDPADVLWSLGRRLEREDPDVLVLSHAELVPTLHAAAAEAGLEGFHLGRQPGWTRLARESTYASYGQVGHSPARYQVPGRAIVDTSNSFLWHQSGLEGLLYMVERSRKPLQEAAWASIGTILTAMQIRLARDWNVLAPLNKWEPETFKDVSTLHAADRGGFTFAPEVGLHEDVYEIDFASLYPRIICQHNISPETVGCDCDSEHETVPGLGYEVCTEDGFLPAVLRPLLDERKRCKRELRRDPPEAKARTLRARSGAIKWVLVSCFGYQGYRNAKFGRIECHEAINAHAREIMLHAKQELEDAGWHVVHGIVDSLWVAARDDREPLGSVTDRISRAVEIELERDGQYEWVCFVPLRNAGGGHSGPPAKGRTGPSGRTTTGHSSASTDTCSSTSTDTRSSTPTDTRSSTPAGALTKYFGKRANGEFKFRGIESRQRSTPAFISDCQREYVETLDVTRDPAAVCDQLARHLGELRRGAVDPADLTITKRVSKSLEAYRQSTHTVSALQRYERHDVARHPGQPVCYVVVDDDARSPERVRVDFETPETYDTAYYAELLIRAAESVTSPLGWDQETIRRQLDDGRTVSLSSFE